MLITDWFFYLVAIPAVFLSGISKGGFAGGIGILAVPLMALAVAPAQAAAIMLPILCAIDLVGLWAYRGKGSRSELWIILPGAAIGILVGALTFRYLDNDTIRILLGAIAVLFALRYYLQSWLARRRAALPAAPAPRSVPKGGFWSAVSGFTSFVAHAGSPPLAVYLYPRRLEKTALQATTVVFFACVNYAKILPYALLGLFPAVNVATSAVLMPLAILGAFLGVWMHRRVPENLFYTLCYAFTLITGGKLLIDGLRGALGV